MFLDFSKIDTIMKKKISVNVAFFLSDNWIGKSYFKSKTYFMYHIIIIFH